jgi:hypothetical protein
MTRALAEDMMSEVSDCISDTHERKMDFEEVRAAHCVFVCVCASVRVGVWAVLWAC